MIERLANPGRLVWVGLAVSLIVAAAVLGPRTWAHFSRAQTDDQLDRLNQLAAATPLPAPARPRAVSLTVHTGANDNSAVVPTPAPIRTPAPATVARGTAEVQRGTITDALPLSGRVTAQDETTVSVEVAGSLDSIDVKLGQQVNAGDELGSLDTGQLERDLETAQARVADATERVKAAEAQLEAQQRQLQQRQAADNVEREGGLSQADDGMSHAVRTLQQLRASVSPDEAPAVEAAITDVTNSRAGLARAAAAIRSVPGASDGPPVDVDSPQRALDQAKVQVAKLQQQLDASHIHAPFTGTVTAIQARTGDKIQQGQTLFRLAHPGEALVQINLTDEDAARLAVGQTATVKLADADPMTVVASQAELTSLSPATDGKPAFAQFRVDWAQTPPPNFGTTVDVAVTLGTKTDVLLVPTKAVHTLAGRHLVDAMDGSSRHAVPVQIGIVAGQQTEILSGLTDGQLIQVGP